MYGGVGCGKTMLMDLFLLSCPPYFKVGGVPAASTSSKVSAVAFLRAASPGMIAGQAGPFPRLYARHPFATPEAQQGERPPRAGGGGVRQGLPRAVPR